MDQPFGLKLGGDGESVVKVEKVCGKKKESCWGKVSIALISPKR